eukprot:TRINITY_DN1104_c0_g1_i3.p1 TRINITY_DN1104_c0_g1~~TRINITY_DN1104_c0_g1_i3.p1  ORF type:complete len:149 (-),score=21.28 TRINITY_DN1104_c0_g1_i3:162-608(-)
MNKKLDGILQDKTNCTQFMNFLKKSHAEENLEFLIGVEKYKKSNGNNRNKEFDKILKEFVNTGSNKEINIESKTRNDIIKKNDGPKEDDLFKDAEQQVKMMLFSGHLDKFLKSEFYKHDPPLPYLVVILCWIIMAAIIFGVTYCALYF